MCSNTFSGFPDPAFPGAEFDFIAKLDGEQREAAVVLNNAVVSAGAGSGKTRVLAARYGWLIMTGRCTVEEILTITFTNKAANEMYRRIYTLLSAHAPFNEYAKNAVEQFHAARISTLDHFCAVIARTVSRHFGVSPDFTSGEVQVRELARSLALRFVLDKRQTPALERLVAEKKMRAVAEELFVRPMLYHSPLSRPLDCAAFEKIQREEILAQWDMLGREADSHAAAIADNHRLLPAGNVLYEQLRTALGRAKTAPGIAGLFTADKNTPALREETAAYLEFLSELKGCSVRGGSRESKEALVIREKIRALRELYETLLALANHALQWDIVTAVFPLMEEYQELLNRRKRETGILTFTDIAHLAVDGLKQYPGIRKMYRDSFKMIMIDEFQDNNGLQRELVDLLLDPAQVFYVGDEKQSIYRFRGADVSVFRALQTEQAGSSLILNHNYRSHPDLIRAFNRIFGGYRNEDDDDPAQGVFPAAGRPVKNYEASYRWVKSGTAGTAETNPRLHFAFLDEGRVDDDDSLRPEDYEALYIARKIRELVNGTTYAYGDCAVLQRSHSSQRSLERAFKLFDIPFNADRPAALFEDAPVNDLWAFLKLLVYPGDRIAYGALLRSPLVRLGEDAFTLCMFRDGEPFDERLDGELPPEDRRRYRKGRRLYRDFCTAAGELPVSALITKLWYEEGYRHEALWSAQAQPYLDLYDLFFEQARTIEEQGKGLVDFLDYLDDLANREEQFDDSALPGEEGGVRIMTIHRCKGLEFPVVFVFGCGSREKTGMDRRLASFSERRGVFLHLPQAEELPEGDNYFFLAEKEEHRNKTHAELKRLLYVAMTRAEKELYVTAVIPPQNKGEREILNEEITGYNREFIAERLEQFKTSGRSALSFLRLLPSLDPDSSFYTLDVIQNYPPDRRGSVKHRQDTAEHSMKEAALAVRERYASIPGVPPYRFVPQTIAASSIHARTAPSPAQPSTGSYSQGEFDFGRSGAVPGGVVTNIVVTNVSEKRRDETDDLLAASGLSAQDFGVIVHGFIEDRFNNRTPEIPRRFAEGNKTRLDKISAAALSMTERFFASPLGRRALAAEFRKTEYPVLTTICVGEKKYLVSGIIDLLFDGGDVFYVVDFKTDRDEDLTRHVGQLAVYKQAVEDIFGKPAACRLFFLRNGHEADLSAEASAVQLLSEPPLPKAPL